MRQPATTTPVILNSWEEIAAYLGRGVRTVQRWERELGLPVHRIGKGKRSPVYATATDLNFWMSTTEAARAPKLRPQLVRVERGNNTPIEDSRRLLADARKLAQTIAETSVRQHRQAEILQERITEMRSRMK
jgi:hypothetical protein